MPEAADVAVLCSGGLDSVVLLASLARGARVQPVYVSAGLAWEPSEREALGAALRTPPFASRAAAPVHLAFSVADLYPVGHWALTGDPPAYDTPDGDVYLPGRNVLLLSKAAVFCAGRGIHRIAIGPLAGNPFPDATPEFFEAVARAFSLGLAHEIAVEAPLAALHKPEVVKLGVELGVPLQMTLSCMRPIGAMHCGLCSKCRERRDAFDEAGIEDRTPYAWPSPRLA
jgi:7-cyano-7-deazaguanine synthase